MDDNIRLIVEDPALAKLLALIRDKYRSLGKVGGSVKLDRFTQEEICSIAGFTGIPPDILTSRSLTLNKFEQALGRTVFSGLSLAELLEQFFGEPLTTKEQERAWAKDAAAAFIRTLEITYPDGAFWWARIASASPDTRWIRSLYRKDDTRLAGLLGRVFEAYRNLPDEADMELLSLFAHRTTGNPHAFDSSQLTGRLLTHCLYVRSVTDGAEDTGMPRSSEELNDLYARFGLTRDDLWSFVTCRGLIASTTDGPHPLWLAAVETSSVLNVPVKMLGDITEIKPAAGCDVWIVENSGVCSALIDLVQDAPIICTHGQFRSAAWIVLDLLAREDVTFHYSGDFDPEGLQMAQRLIDRYPKRVKLWRMDDESYRMAMSEEDISGRAAKLDGLTDPGLIELAEELRRSGKAGYQEGLLKLLAQDMRV
ncbi:TIGR02679 family protein [Bhargavaea beijingensis]|uniref:TIGR02679 family protein n=1 Tax=Bhargavaea beijingensis TaxID=426756 RepID=A0A1G7A7L9_9BACL|nr:TIGR02679 family protein [Bhargavaea beijingensis]SDE10055.1 TIGR02679 family protein [Bhargavaea beijingensis]